jgi:hypothetical protein
VPPIPEIDFINAIVKSINYQAHKGAKKIIKHKIHNNFTLLALFIPHDKNKIRKTLRETEKRDTLKIPRGYVKRKQKKQQKLKMSDTIRLNKFYFCQRF